MLDYTQTSALEDACAQAGEEFRKAAAKRRTSRYKELAEAAYELARREQNDALKAYADEERRLSGLHLRTFICTDYDRGRHSEPIVVLARSVSDARSIINTALANEGRPVHGIAPFSLYECWERGATRILGGTIPQDLTALHEDPVRWLDSEREGTSPNLWPRGPPRSMEDVVAVLTANAPPIEDPLAELFS